MPPESMKLADLDEPLAGAAVIGDIHGCADTLDALLARIPDDRPIFFVGDLIDRGPASRQVIDRLIERGARGVCGNHELWMRKWLRGEELDTSVLLPGFGAAATLRSYGLEAKAATLRSPPREAIPRAHRDFFLGLPHVLGITVGGQGWWLVHAGLPPVRAGAPTDMVGWVESFGMQLLWEPAPAAARPKADRPVIMGHVPQLEFVDLGHVVAIDTGAGLWDDGRLSALLLPERVVVAVP